VVEHAWNPSPDLRSILPGDDTYRVEVTAVASDVQFRAPQRTAWPRIHGTEHAVIDGPATSRYAQIDGQGRYAVKFHFDESDHGGGKASTRVRMLQPHGGGIEGFHFPLRAGTEVVCSFAGGDPDRPSIAGVVPNALTPSPVTLGNHTRNVIQTGGRNRIELEDAEGQEGIVISSPYDNTYIRMGAPGDGDGAGPSLAGSGASPVPAGGSTIPTPAGGSTTPTPATPAGGSTSPHDAGHSLITSTTGNSMTNTAGNKMTTTLGASTTSVGGFATSVVAGLSTSVVLGGSIRVTTPLSLDLLAGLRASFTLGPTYSRFMGGRTTVVTKNDKTTVKGSRTTTLEGNTDTTVEGNSKSVVQGNSTSIIQKLYRTEIKDREEWIAGHKYELIDGNAFKIVRNEMKRSADAKWNVNGTLVLESDLNQINARLQLRGADLLVFT
jgi:type VI secretion system secreted protein VgrG